MITTYKPVFQQFNIGGVRHITPENAYSELMNGKAIMVDVRERDEYTLESIPLNDVFYYPLSTIMDYIKNIPGEKPIIVVCNAGVRSTKVVNVFNRAGFPDTANLDGGIISWKAQGLPVVGILPESCGCGCSCSA